MAEAMSDLEARVEDQQAIAPPPRRPSLPHFQQQPQPAPAVPRDWPPVQSPPPEPFVPPQAQQAETYAANPAHQQRDMSELDRRYGVHTPRRGDEPAHLGAYPQPDDHGPDRGFPDVAATQPEEPPLPEQPKPNLAMRELITSALNANRVELHLQPIVSLPQRQVKYYEAFTRLRDAEGTLIEARSFLPEAVMSGQIARIDNLLLFRSIQVVRRLTSRNRNAILFCNISSQSLTDETFFPGFLEFVRDNQNFADVLVFEFSQADVAAMGALELESLSALYELGFRFSVDRISDMKMDFNALAGRGFKFGKLHADYLIGRREANHGHIHPSDFGDLLHRYGMQLITDHVETESQVLELLDYDVKLAQGTLFSPPRPVRAEVLQGAPAPGPVRSAMG